MQVMGVRVGQHEGCTRRVFELDARASPTRLFFPDGWIDLSMQARPTAA